MITDSITCYEENHAGSGKGEIKLDDFRGDDIRAKTGIMWRRIAPMDLEREHSRPGE